MYAVLRFSHELLSLSHRRMVQSVYPREKLVGYLLPDFLPLCAILIAFSYGGDGHQTFLQLTLSAQ